MLEAFAAGCGAQLVQTSARHLEPGAAAFYGVRPDWGYLWQQAKREGRRWYYLDNAWFDAGRERYFRVGVNATQTWSRGPSDGSRLQALGVSVRPLSKPAGGRHIVVCRQSDEYMAFNAKWPGGAMGWQEAVLNELRRYTDRFIVVRGKQSKRPLAEDLKGAWALVTHSSAAAIEALIAGLPAVVTDHACAAGELRTRFAEIEKPPTQDGVLEWAQRLADSQWTLDELRQGAAWKAING